MTSHTQLGPSVEFRGISLPLITSYLFEINFLTFVVHSLHSLEARAKSGLHLWTNLRQTRRYPRCQGHSALCSILRLFTVGVSYTRLPTMPRGYPEVSLHKRLERGNKKDRLTITLR